MRELLFVWKCSRMHENKYNIYIEMKIIKGWREVFWQLKIAERSILIIKSWWEVHQQFNVGENTSAIESWRDASAIETIEGWWEVHQ